MIGDIRKKCPFCGELAVVLRGTKIFECTNCHKTPPICRNCMGSGYIWDSCWGGKHDPRDILYTRTCECCCGKGFNQVYVTLEEKL